MIPSPAELSRIPVPEHINEKVSLVLDIIEEAMLDGASFTSIRETVIPPEYLTTVLKGVNRVANEKHWNVNIASYFSEEYGHSWKVTWAVC